MAPFPFALNALIGPIGAALVYLAIGFAFGYVLEIAGFGSSPKLAAQFYFRDLTVLKVMFTGIVVAMLLIFGASALSLLDLNLIWVNPTYLWPGLLGGLIMGVGFILGGLCPGTSLVALSTLKVDGLFYVLGALFGIFLFGETVDSFGVFWNSSYLGRLMLPEWLGLPTGVVALIVVLMALFMFWGGEQLERIVGGVDLKRAPKLRYAGAGLLVLGGVALVALGQPTTAEKWSKVAAKMAPQLSGRQVYIEPGELLHTLHDHELKLLMLDVRDEADYNLFHLADARHVPQAQIDSLIDELHEEPANTVIVLMSNDEAAATGAWKVLAAESVRNVYVLEGGVNAWLDVFAVGDGRIQAIEPGGEDELRYAFSLALGGAFPASDPDPHAYELEYTPKIKLEMRRGPTGKGCG